MLEWMYWTYPTMIFLGLVIAFFVALIILDLKYRSLVPKKGFLPFYTTRGDKVFLGIVFMIIIGILWLVFVPLPMTYALILGFVALFVIVIWG